MEGPFPSLLLQIKHADPPIDNAIRLSFVSSGFLSQSVTSSEAHFIHGSDNFDLFYFYLIFPRPARKVDNLTICEPTV
jgi:hypothetical protein